MQVYVWVCVLGFVSVPGSRLCECKAFLLDVFDKVFLSFFEDVFGNFWTKKDRG